MQRNWRTAADVKSVHDHLSRHHAGPKIERACFDIGPSTSTYMPATQTSDRRREPPFGPSPLAPQPDGLVRIISMVLRDHASLVTHSNHNFVGITVIKASQRRICPTMLALTSHYSATNAKHPRYAPGLSPESITRCDHWARYWCEKSFAAVRSGGARDIRRDETVTRQTVAVRWREQ
jgi:hypothetical protein